LVGHYVQGHVVLDVTPPSPSPSKPALSLPPPPSPSRETESERPDEKNSAAKDGTAKSSPIPHYEKKAIAIPARSKKRNLFQKMSMMAKLGGGAKSKPKGTVFIANDADGGTESVRANDDDDSGGSDDDDGDG
jgi:hypothetical protein